ncbi:hypothetical protein [Frigoribacterium sp. 2355]
MEPPRRSGPPGRLFSSRTASRTSPPSSSAFQSTLSSVVDATYFGISWMVRAKGCIQSGNASEAGGRQDCSISS